MSPAGVGRMASPFRPGTVLSNGRYTVLERISGGCTGNVYRAYDHTEQKAVALKVVSSSSMDPGVLMKTLKREVHCGHVLHHVNIVKLIDLFVDVPNIVTVWEFVDGPDLLSLLNDQDGCMSEDMAAFYFFQIVQGVNFMHRNGFCHRDIKLENCMVDKKSNRIKIVDLGLAATVHNASTRGVGTVDYMAPEILIGRFPVPPKKGKKYDGRLVDVWAMGVLLYVLVTGKYPFEDRATPGDSMQTMANVLQGNIQPLPDRVSASCAELIHKMLQFKPSKRLSLSSIADHHWLKSHARKFARRHFKSSILRESMDWLEKGGDQSISASEESIPESYMEAIGCFALPQMKLREGPNKDEVEINSSDGLLALGDESSTSSSSRLLSVRERWKKWRIGSNWRVKGARVKNGLVQKIKRNFVCGCPSDD